MAEYYLIVKTGEAEMKALEQTSPSVLDGITPIVELTRGRKLPSREKDPELRKKEKPRYPYDKRLDRIKEILAGRKVIFDLTSDIGLISDEIDFLYDPGRGYNNWVSFLIGLRDSNAFSELIPTIVITSKDTDIDAGMTAQTKQLTAAFDSIAYRSDIFDDNCYFDLEHNIVPYLNNKRLYVIIDCSYVIQASIGQYFERVRARIDNLKSIVPPGTEIIVSATSFPRNIGEIGNDDNDVFKLSEVVISQRLKSAGINVHYSDYGSINPIRNDSIVMAHGWVPRIDVPLSDSVYYCRERKAKSEDYPDAYVRVARKVISNLLFPTGLENNWGIQQIRNCAGGSCPGSTPSFWITVRMCIHLEQQFNRLAKL